MAYVKTDWENLPSTDTPITETALDNMENGIEYNDQRLNGTKPMGSIVVNDINGKNIFKEIFRQGNQGYTTAGSRIFSMPNEFRLNAGTYTFSTDLDTSTFDYAFYTGDVPFGNSSATYTQISNGYLTDASFTFTLASDTYVGFTIRRKNENAIVPSDVASYKFQIEVGNTATPYTPYNQPVKQTSLGVKESCTFYADDFKCRNMLDVNKKIAGGYDGSGNWVNSSNYITVQYIPVKANTQYIMSSLSLDLTKYTTLRIISWNSSMNFISRSNAIYPSNNTFTFTTPNNTAFIAVCFYTAQTASVSDLTQGQLEIGSEATNYTPYKNFDGGIYSLGEVKIGTWVDGKPLYGKVVNFGALPNNTTKSVLHNIENIDYVTNLYGVSNSSSTRIPINWYDGSNYISTYINNTSIAIKTSNDRSSYSVYVVVEYTKTTSGTRSIETSGE